MSHRNLLLNAGEEMNRCTERSNEGDWCTSVAIPNSRYKVATERRNAGKICDTRISKTDNYCAGAIAVAMDCPA